MTQPRTIHPISESSNGSRFSVRVGDFEGPLGLLLGLIERRKMHIGDISLAEISESYLDHIKTLPDTAMGDIAEFIYVGATLLLIKSFALLPGTKLSEDESSAIENLKRRADQYGFLVSLRSKLFKNSRRSFFRERTESNSVLFTPPEISSNDLLANILTCSSTLGQNSRNFFTPLKETEIRRKISLTETLASIRTALRLSPKTTFASMGNKDRETLIVAFIAILELAKQGNVDLEQDPGEETIHIETRELNVPQYGL